MAHFLEKQGFKKQALMVSMDAEHKFDLQNLEPVLKAASAVQPDFEEMAGKIKDYSKALRCSFFVERKNLQLKIRATFDT